MRISDWSSDVCSSDLSWVTLFTKESVTEYLIVQIVGAAIAVVTMLISGVVADRIGRRTTLGIGAILIAIFSIAGMTPLFAEGTTFGAYIFILVGFALLGFSHAQAAGAVTSSFARQFRYSEIGRAHVCTPVTNAHPVCRLL